MKLSENRLAEGGFAARNRKVKIIMDYNERQWSKTDQGRKEKREVERFKYLYETWQRLKHFNSKSTGSEALDKEILEKIGPWRKGQ